MFAPGVPTLIPPFHHPVPSLLLKIERMPLLRLTLSKRKGSELTPEVIQFGSNPPLRLFPSEYSALNKAKKGILSLCDLCVAQVVWDKKREGPPPYSESSSRSRTLHSAVADGAEWLDIIFGMNPRDKFLRNYGSEKEKTNRTTFTEFVTVDVKLHNSPTIPLEHLQSYSDNQENPASSQPPPFLELRHIHHRNRFITSMTALKKTTGFFICESDEICVSAKTISPDKLSIFWIDSSFDILILHSPFSRETNDFTSHYGTTVDHQELLINPPIGFDNNPGMEIAVAIAHKNHPTQNLVDSLYKTFVEYAKQQVPCGIAEWHSVSSGDMLEHSRKLGAHPITTRRRNLPGLIELLGPWAASFQCVFIPHKYEE